MHDYYIVWLETQFEVWKETYAKSNSLTGGSLDINFANQILFSIKQTREFPWSQKQVRVHWEKPWISRLNVQVVLQRLASWKCWRFILLPRVQTEVQVLMRTAVMLHVVDTMSYKLEAIFLNWVISLEIYAPSFSLGKKIRIYGNWTKIPL